MARAEGLRARSTGVLIAYLALSLTWGSSFFSIKISLAGLSPEQLVLGRLVLGALTLNLILLLTRRRWPTELALVGHMAIVAFFLCVLPLLLFAWAGQYIPSGLSSIYNATTPLMTMVLGLALLPTEKLGRVRSLGIFLGAAGIMIVLAPWQFLDGFDSATGTILPQVACLCGTASYGVAFTYLRRFVSRKHSYDSVTIAAVQVGLAAAMMLVVSPLVATGAVDLDWRIALAVVVLGVLASGVAYIWNTTIVEQWGATLASTVTYISPLVGVVLGVVALGERIFWHQPVGAVIVIFGILISQGVLGKSRKDDNGNERGGIAGVRDESSQGGAERERPQSRVETR